MEAWKERLKEEYEQTKERYEKLKEYIRRQEITEKLSDEKESLKSTYASYLLKCQKKAMGEYLDILEARAELYGIEL